MYSSCLGAIKINLQYSPRMCKWNSWCQRINVFRLVFRCMYIVKTNSQKLSTLGLNCSCRQAHGQIVQTWNPPPFRPAARCLGSPIAGKNPFKLFKEKDQLYNLGSCDDVPSIFDYALRFGHQHYIRTIKYPPTRAGKNNLRFREFFDVHLVRGLPEPGEFAGYEGFLSAKWQMLCEDMGSRLASFLEPSSKWWSSCKESLVKLARALNFRCRWFTSHVSYLVPIVI